MNYPKIYQQSFISLIVDKWEKEDMELKKMEKIKLNRTNQKVKIK